MTKASIARQYRDKFGMAMPTLKLARIMYEKEKLTFKDVEDARSVLRLIEGKHGKNRGVTITHEAKERPRNPYNLPTSDETIYEPFKIEAKRLAVLSDIHIPYHSIEALTATFDYLKHYKPDAILLNGDTLDFHGLSRFVRDPKKRHFAEELTAFEQFMETLNNLFKCKVYFKIGNHEERYEHFLWQKAGELVGVEEFELEAIIKKRADVEIIGEKRIMKAGDLNIIHGHEFGTGFFSPVNVARGLFLRAKVSAMQGHNHQTSEHTEPNLNGQIVTTWSLGCLCELHPAYLPINKWNLGFAVVDINGDNFEVQNKRIWKGKIL
jgi:predicted phosphodiesterase